MQKDVTIASIGAAASIFIAIISGGFSYVAGRSAGQNAAKSFAPTPTGMIAFFDSKACPQEWSPRQDAEGRYLVGLSQKHIGSLSQVVGTPLDDLENRPTGNHTHSYEKSTLTKNPQTYGIARGQGTDALDYSSNNTQTSSVFGTIPGRIIDGTNAPYMQLLVCEKN